MKTFHAILKKSVCVFMVVAMLAVSIPLIATKTQAATLTQNQANMVARCNYMFNSTWICQKTITSWKNQSYFYAGTTYRIPYAWPVNAGRWVGDTSYGISVTDFLTATQNASSDFYTKQSYCNSNAGSYAPYYGNDCSTFVTYCWGLSARKTTSTLANVATLIGNTTTANVNSYLQIGDALNYAGSHVVFVSNIVRDASNNITSIEITEQTPPQLKRTNHTVASLVSKYGANYKIYRYSGTVSAPPSGAGVVTGSANPDSYTMPTSALTTGASGTGVSWIQAVLVQLGYSLTVDGAYGNNTAVAVATFQQDYGITCTGSADTTTIAKLQTLWANKNGYYTTTAGSLNMRTGAGTSYDVITSLPQGSSVAVVGFNSAGTWANVIYNGTKGWVSKSYLTFVRKFNYTANYNTNISATITPVSFRHDRTITVAAAPANSSGDTLRGWQLLRASDWVWYDGSSWISDQGSSKLYQPGEKITFSSSMLSSNAGDDSFYLCAVWGSAVIPDVVPVTPTNVAPSKYGWKWPAAEAYGFFGNYGGNGQDIELSVDLCLLPSDQPSSACLYTNGTDKRIVIDQTAVTIGETTVAYNWGELSLNNWHDVNFKIIGNTAYVFIDGKLIASDRGYAANETYQLLFSLTGEMAIDNATLYRSSDGYCFFSLDFEDASDAQTVMGSGLGQRTLLFPDTSDFTVSITPTSSTITGTGDVTFTAKASAGEGHTYTWSSSNSALNKYMTASGSTCYVSIPSELSSSITSTITCTVTSDGGVTKKSTTSFTYNPYPAPSVSALSPSTSSVIGTGSATYTATASGDGLSYKWSSSDSTLNAYMSATANTLKINIPAELTKTINATITCTVTNSYGKTASKTATFSYTPAPAPVISSITPSSASIEDTGSVKYTAAATGDGLTYKWTSSNSALNKYLSGASTSTLTVSIPEELTENISATLTLTVTNSYGKTATMTAQFEYTFTPEGETTVIMVGDVSGDGYITAADINILKRVVGGSTNLSAELFSAADVNGDGNVTALDCNILARYIAGVVSEFN